MNLIALAITPKAFGVKAKLSMNQFSNSFMKKIYWKLWLLRQSSRKLSGWKQCFHC